MNSDGAASTLPSRDQSLRPRVQFLALRASKANPEVVPMPTVPTHPISRDIAFVPTRSSGMKAGDVLVSRPTARADVYEISVVPSLACLTDVRYEDGRETGRQLARRLAVDGWFTSDHTHFLRIATYRL